MFHSVSLPNLIEIQQEVLPVISSEYDLEKTTFSWTKTPEKYLSLSSIRQVIDSLELNEYVHGVTINITNKRTSAIHVDHGKFKYSLNIPILNTENTYLKFYDVKPGVDKNGKLTVVGTKKYYGFDQDEVVEAQCIETTIPGYVDTSSPHSFESHNEKARIMLLIRLKEHFNLEKT
jgi:hypothetical protein